MVNLTYENNEKGWFALKWDGVDPGYEKLISSDRTPACLNDMRWMLCAVHMLDGVNKSGWNYLVICQIPTHHISLLKCIKSKKKNSHISILDKPARRSICQTQPKWLQILRLQCCHSRVAQNDLWPKNLRLLTGCPEWPLTQKLDVTHAGRRMTF